MKALLHRSQETATFIGDIVGVPFLFLFSNLYASTHYRSIFNFYELFIEKYTCFTDRSKNSNDSLGSKERLKSSFLLVSFK